MGGVPPGAAVPDQTGVGHREERDDAQAVEAAKETDASGPASSRGVGGSPAPEPAVRPRRDRGDIIRRRILASRSRVHLHDAVRRPRLIQVVGHGKPRGNDARRLRASTWSTAGPTPSPRSSGRFRAETAARLWPASTTASSLAPAQGKHERRRRQRVIQAVLLGQFDLVAEATSTSPPA